MQISLSDTSCAFHGKVLSGEEEVGRGEALGARFAHTGAGACTLRAPPGPHPPICMHGCSSHFKKKKKKRNLMHYGSDPIRELFTDFEGVFSHLFEGIHRTLFNQKLSL